nr:Chain A, Peptide from Histone H3.3 [Homo sapiens]
STGRVKKPHRY